MRCPSCSSSAVLYDRLRGEQICTRCGLVIVDRSFELEPEWRRRPGEELERADATAGIDVTQHDLGLGSKFSVSNELPPSLRAKLRRMQYWQRRSRASSWEERSLREALVELDKLCEDLGLPKGIKAEISSLYRRAKAARLTVGRETHQVLAALIFITCRMRGLPRTEGEISLALAARSKLKKREAVRSLRLFTKFLARKLNLKLPRVSTDDYIDRFASQLGLSVGTIGRAHEFHEVLPKNFRQAKPPLLMAAVVLYIAAEMEGEKVNLKKIASTVGVGISSLSRNVALARKLSSSVG